MSLNWSLISTLLWMITWKSAKRQESPPSKEFKGSFNVRVTPELHRSTYFYAHENGLTLNELMSRSLKNYLDEKNIHLQAKKKPAHRAGFFGLREDYRSS